MKSKAKEEVQNYLLQKNPEKRERVMDVLNLDSQETNEEVKIALLIRAIRFKQEELERKKERIGQMWEELNLKRRSNLN